MAKRFEKRHILTLGLTVAILAAVGVFGVAATLASTDNWLHVELPYAATASTDTLTAAADGAAVNVTVKQGAGDCHITAYDLIVYAAGGAAVAPVDSSLTVEQYAECTVVRDLPIDATSVSFDAAVGHVYAYPAAESDGVRVISYGNAYADDFFALQTLNNGAMANPTDPIAADGAFKNVFITGGFTVDRALTFTPPCALHLLRSAVELKADLTLRHNYGGIYGIDADGGKLMQNGGALSVTTPNAFFGVQSGVVTDAAGAAVEPPVVCSPQALTAEAAGALVQNMLDAAQGYLTAYVPARLTRSLILPSAYAASGVTYAYAVSDAAVMTTHGVISRAAADKNVTLTVTARYNGIYNKVYTGAGDLTFTLDRLVVGTGAQAAADELSRMLGEALTKSLTDADGDGKFAPTGDVDLTELLTAYRKLAFDGADNLTIAVSEPSGSSLAVGGIRTDTYNVTASTAGDDVRLAFASRLINGTALNVSVTANGGAVQAVLPTYTLAGLSLAEVTDLLETLIYTPEFSSAESVYPYVGLYDNALCRGAERVASSLGVTAAELKAIALTDDELTALNDAADKQQYIRGQWPQWKTDAKAFTVDALTNAGGALTGGTVRVKTLAADTHYVVVQRFTVDTDLADAVTYDGEYYAYRVALVPDQGIGGSDTTQYIAGNTFADFYETLDGGRLLESYGYAFGIDTTGIGIYATIEGDAGDSCRFVYRASGGSYKPVTAADADSFAATEYFIEIDVEKFPARNRTAKAKIYFYYTAQTDAFIAYAQNGFADDEAHPEYAASCFTTQSYGFTLPGIYRAGAGLDFNSAPLYDFVLNAKDADGGYIYDAYRKHADADGKFAYDANNYLYVDGAAAVCARLDCRGLVTASPIDLKGIELLTGTAGFVFDGVPIGSIADAFASVGTHIEMLSFRNCGLTADILGAYLTNCQGLTEIDLSGNAVGSLRGLLYRTVRTLRVAGCGLTTLAGVSELPNLTELDLSDNAIKYFGALTSLTKLRTVDVSGNKATDDNILPGGGVAYGTAGEVNIPVYVYLLNVRETTIIGDSGNITVGDGISAEQQLASLILTGVEYDRTFTGALTMSSFNKEVVWDGVTYTVISEKLIGADFVAVAPDAIKAGDAFYFLVTVTYARQNADGVTASAQCYALYEATYGGAA